MRALVTIEIGAKNGVLTPFFAPISIVTSVRTRYGLDVFDGNIITTNKLLLLSRFTEFTFCLEISDKRKLKNELRSIKKVFLK